MNKIHAPWDEETVRRLNAYQASGAGHPYTCDRTHSSDPEAVLVATPGGWACPHCNYEQGWAWDAMASPRLRLIPEPTWAPGDDVQGVQRILRDGRNDA